MLLALVSLECGFGWVWCNLRDPANGKLRAVIGKVDHD